MLTNFSETNMGCRNRMTSGLDFVFGEVERAILLEDDCLPHPTFFQFCEESLERYRDDERIGMISGDNFQFGTVRTAHSYYFSRYGHIWGWATWRRAWNHYDRNASGWPAFRDGGWLDAWTHSAGERDFWARCFDTVREGRVDAWDYQWLLTAMIQGTLAVIPEVNLVSNIGFGADATHTKVAGAYTNVATMPMLFPLSHPTIIQRHGKADAFAAKAYGA
ncbi:MAG: glycosyltransferase family 2 protein [Myxococcales bacterium]|nr:glycosyltransferase family 2 protein [Myxococcales bacterium]